MQEYIKKLKSMNACRPAIDWLEKNDYPTPQKAWDACEDGNWMAWLVDKTQDKKTRIFFGTKFARLVEKYNPAISPILDVYDRYVGGTATDEELTKAAGEARVTEAWVAAEAGKARAAAVAWVAAEAGGTGRARAAEANMLRQCAGIVREMFPKCPEI